MATLIHNANQSLESVLVYQSELQKSEVLQERLSMARSWYFIEREGQYIYAPSKWVGYADMTAEEYATDSKKNSGRITEQHLSKWYEPISTSSRDHGRHLERLTKFLAEFGKTPNAKARFNVLAVNLEQDGSEENGEILALIIAVVEKLPANEQAILKKHMGW